MKAYTKVLIAMLLVLALAATMIACNIDPYADGDESESQSVSENNDGENNDGENNDGENNDGENNDGENNDGGNNNGENGDGGNNDGGNNDGGNNDGGNGDANTNLKVEDKPEGDETVGWGEIHPAN